MTDGSSTNCNLLIPFLREHLAFFETLRDIHREDGMR